MRKITQISKKHCSVREVFLYDLLVFLLRFNPTSFT